MLSPVSTLTRTKSDAVAAAAVDEARRSDPPGNAAACVGGAVAQRHGVPELSTVLARSHARDPRGRSGRGDSAAPGAAVTGRNRDEYPRVGREEESDCVG